MTLCVAASLSDICENIAAQQLADRGTGRILRLVEPLRWGEKTIPHSHCFYSMTTLFNHVLNIVALRSEKKVLGFDALAVVTAMQNIKAILDFAVMENP